MSYYVYIVTNPNNSTLYTGVTNNLEQRLIEHYLNGGNDRTFAGKYYCYLLLFYEAHQYINNAIDREKEIKGWRREKKEALIRSFNPERMLLNEELFGRWPPAQHDLNKR